MSDLDSVRALFMSLRIITMRWKLLRENWSREIWWAQSQSQRGYQTDVWL